MKKIISVISFVICIVIIMSITVSAESVSDIVSPAYDFNEYDESVTAPPGFQYSGSLTAENIGLQDSFKEPQDMCISGESLFVLDSGNSRIIELDINTMKCLKIYSGFTDKAGNAFDFTNAQGMTLGKNGEIYIADTENNRILVCNKNGTVTNVILRPDKALADNDYPFRATKLQAGRYGELYAIVDGIDLGIFVFDTDYNFSSFVGSNKVVATKDVLFSYFMRRFMTLRQLQTRIQSTPLIVNNFCMDSRGFIYTVSSNSKSIPQDGMVRCLNYESTDVLSTGTTYGDLEHNSEDLNGTKTAFSAVEVDKDGFLYLLDGTRGRIFVYSEDGFLISEFGARGDQKGCFGEPEDIAVYSGNIYVLDSVKNRIYIFERTEYAETFFSAANAFKNRDFDTSLALWKKAKALNTNSLYPYYGMAMIYDSLGQYKEAMENYRLAGKRTEYSDVFREYRKDWLKHNSWIVAIAAAVIIAAGIAIAVQYKKALKCEDGSVYSVSEQNSFLFPFYLLFHPIEGADQFRRRNIHTVKAAGIIIALWFAVASLAFYKTGFIFNSERRSEFNPAAILISTVGVYALFVLSNWCISTFLDGKGKFKEIACLTAYALIPYVFSLLLNIGMSNILSLSESIFLNIISFIGLFWSLFVLIFGMYSLHEYSFSKTLVSLLFTVIGMLIAVFLIVMFYTLIKQGADFIFGLYSEARLRGGL